MSKELFITKWEDFELLSHIEDCPDDDCIIRKKHGLMRVGEWILK